MNKATPYIDQLRLQGFRITKMRRTFLEVLAHASNPMTAVEIDEALQKKATIVNKTSIYREIDFLVSQNILKAIQFNEDKKRYELIRDHHHHLVCEKCQHVQEVKIKQLEDIFPQVEEGLRNLKDFTLVNHSLEFFGVCGKCS